MIVKYYFLSAARTALFSLVSLTFFSTVSAAEKVSISRAKLLAVTCVACHGPDGSGSKRIPKIKDLDTKDFIATMKGFQTGEEKSTIMNRYAEGYSDSDIKLLAQYFAQIK